MSEQKCVLLNWNMRGLNNSARRKVVRDLLGELRSTVVCLEETKLSSVDQLDVKEIMGHGFDKNFAYLLAQQTRGGVRWW